VERVWTEPVVEVLTLTKVRRPVVQPALEKHENGD
jgi:hypothetical protein